MRLGSYFDNVFLVIAVLSSLALFAASIYVPYLRGLLGTVFLSGADWVMVIMFGIVNTAMVEVLKLFLMRPGNSNKK